MDEPTIDDPPFATTLAHASADPFRLLVEAVHDYGIFMLDPAGNVSSWNSGAANSKGYTAEEIVGQHVSCFYTAEDVAAGKPEQGLTHALEAGRFEEEAVRVRKGGTPFWAIVTITNIQDAAGQHLGFAVVTRDITERKEAEDQLHASMNAFRSMANSVPVVLWITDPSGACTFVNDQWSHWTGQSLAAAAAAGWVDRVHPDDRSAAVARFMESNAKQRPHQNEFRIQLANGDWAWALAIANPRFEPAGEFVGYFGCLLDVTEHRTLEHQLRQSQKMDAFGQLAGGVAHDFNNILTVISGYSEMVLGAMDPLDPSRNALTAISQAGDRAASLTRQLLSFSRLTVLAPRVLLVNAMVEQSAAMLRRMIDEDIVLTTVFDPDSGQVRFDPGQMGQVLMNLALNARDAMAHGGTLTIATSHVVLDEHHASQHASRKPGRYATISVCDTGCGMTPEVQGRIFEPFFTTKAPGKGTGLGLATVYGIVTQSDGDIEVSTTPGGGTTFTVYLPAVDEPPDDHLAPVTTAAGGSETVLLVEDDDTVRAMALLALETRGYTVLHAESGKMALALFTEHDGHVDLLLTDVVMPEINGRELADALCVQRPALKVLYLTGYTDDAVLRSGIMQSEVAFLQKPYTPLSLARKVRDVLDTPAAIPR